MARRLRIEWETGRKVTARLEMPEPAVGAAILLAHGAGAGQDHPWMVSMRRLLASTGRPTMTFNYAYTEEGRRSPDRAARSLEVHRAAADRLAAYSDRVVLAGKSMGGRIGSHLAGDDGWPAAALVYLGYPLVAMGKTDPRPTGHLESITVPQMFVSGTRDRLGPAPLIEALAARVPDGTYVPVDEGDHSLRVPKRTGLTNEQALERVASRIAGWLEDRGL